MSASLEIQLVQVLVVGDKTQWSTLVHVPENIEQGAAADSHEPIEELLRHDPDRAPDDGNARPLFTTLRVSNVSQAIELMRQNAFDLILVNEDIINEGLDDSHAERGHLERGEIEQGDTSRNGDLSSDNRLARLRALRDAAADTPLVLVLGNDLLTAVEALRQNRLEDGRSAESLVDECLFRDRLTSDLLQTVLARCVDRHRQWHQQQQRIEQLEQDTARLRQDCDNAACEIENLVRINRELDDFTCIIAHDLKEPLHGICGYADILLLELGEHLDDDSRRRLLGIANMGNRLMSMVSDLLTYCRVSREKTVTEEVDLNQVVHETLRRLRPTIEQYGGMVHVINRFPKVRGNETLWSMALSNLITNGLKFNDSAQPMVEIGCLDQGQRSTFYVRDNGIGIPQEHFESIFQIFRRLHGRKQYDGSGIGLAIVRKVVETFGARIYLKSQPGEGATFFITWNEMEQSEPDEVRQKDADWPGCPECRMPREVINSE